MNHLLYGGKESSNEDSVKYIYTLTIIKKSLKIKYFFVKYWVVVREKSLMLSKKAVLRFIGRNGFLAYL